MATNPLNNKASSSAIETGKSVHLSASAGSGKTRALKDRYLALLDALDRRKLNIDQAVAITFTDKAAAEIKERVLHGLAEPMLKKIIRGRQDLRISTIHSFCMNLLKRYPLEAGLPPDFGVLDSRDQASKISQAIEDTLEASDRDPVIMNPLLGFTVDELVKTIEYLIAVRSRLKRMEIDAGGPDGLIRSVSNGMDIGFAENEVRSLLVRPEWRASLLRMEQLLQAEGEAYDVCAGPHHILLAEACNAEAAFRISSEMLLIYFTRENAPRKLTKIAASACKAKKNRKEYEDLYFSIQAMLYQLRNNCERIRAGLEAVSMLRLYLRAEERYQAAKLREGLLDFDDLEIGTYRLLQSLESPDILYWLDRKILHFLVDEFQDTSDIQWAILDKLTSEIFSGKGADKFMTPTLFVVGDEKQSIYRFREANYRLIENVRQKMETYLSPDAREIRTLEKNFRSTTEVIETVNSVFAGLWQGSYAPSEVARTEHTGSARLIEVLAGAAGPTEAELLARELRSLKENNTIVYDRTDAAWETRPMTYDDCAILIQSRTRLKEYEAALQDAGVPFRVVGGIGFYEEDEIQAIMNTLFFLRNNDDKLALAAALTSALFALTDKDLFDLTQDSRGMLSALKELRPDAHELIHSWQSLAGLVPLASLMHTIINNTGAYVRFGRKSPQAIFNIDKLLDTARDFDRRGYTTLQDFVDWVRNIRRTEQREAAADMNLPGVHGSVSILTVHKAKGLEFPVVFLPGMNQVAKSLSTGPDSLIHDAKGIVRMAIKDSSNPVYEEMWKGDEGEQQELMREHQRLLYVAMTRARDHLVMIGTLRDGKTPISQNTWLDYLHRTILAGQGNGDASAPRILHYSYPSWQPQDRSAEPAPIQRSTQPRSPGVSIDVRAVLENLSPIPRSGAMEWKRATDFNAPESGTAIWPAALPVQAPVVSPLLRGTVLHRCLEEYAGTGVYELDSMLQHPELLALDAETRSQFRNDVDTVLRSILGNKDLTWIFERGPDTYSELPFLYNKQKSIVSGIIDRLIVRHRKGFVVDYKSILIENDTALAFWKEHYRPQIELYCEAAKDIFGLESVEGYLLFLDSNRLEVVMKG